MTRSADPKAGTAGRLVEPREEKVTSSAVSQSQPCGDGAHSPSSPQASEPSARDRWLSENAESILEVLRFAAGGIGIRAATAADAGNPYTTIDRDLARIEAVREMVARFRCLAATPPPPEPSAAWRGIDTVSQSRPGYDGERAASAGPEPSGPVNCTYVLQRPGVPYPRTCERCRLGPCPFYNKDGSAKR